MEFEWKIPNWANTIERDRARIYFIAYAAGMALHFVEQALDRINQGDVKTFEDFKVPDEAIGCGFHEAVRGVLSHHLVIRKGKIANYHPYPPTPWNASPRDRFGTPGPYEDAVQGLRIFEENGAGQVQGHRHHAHGAELRPVPAVRRPHVHGRRARHRAAARADARQLQQVREAGKTMGTISNVRVGKPDTKPSALEPHERHARRERAPTGQRVEPGFKVARREGSARPGRRSTGINAKDREPIDPRSPKLTPA